VISIVDGVMVPESEIAFTASRSGGPGGQNVNKVSSRVTLSFDVMRSSALSEDQKTRISRKLAKRINKEGILRVVSQRTRSQELNRSDAMMRFAGLLRQALAEDRPRIKTKVSAGARERRLEEKKKRRIVKQQRSRTADDTD
jgi:ribosome-associated protein